MKIARKWVLGFLGALVVGALGSGLWETIFRPVFSWLGRIILTTVSFGTNAFIDGVYKEAARGLHEHAASELLILVTAALLTLPFAVVLPILRKSFLLRKHIETEEKDQPTITTLQIEVKEQLERLKQLTRLIYILGLCAFFIYGAYGVLVIQALAATEVYASFEQAMTICRPFVADGQFYSLQSRFARISSKAEYLALMREVRNIASINHVTLPPQPSW